MRVLVAPDSFTGSMSAPEAGAAITAGWHRHAPADELTLAPLSDGGPGFVATLAAALGGATHPIDSVDPWGRPVTGEVLVVGPTAYLESAQFLGTSGREAGDPVIASSRGLGRALAEVLRLEPQRIVIGLGGSAITDGGAGLLAELGATADDGSGGDRSDLLRSGGDLRGLAHVDLSAPRALLAGIELVAASDVDNPLLGNRGAARGYAPQKGAGPGEVEVLEQGLTALAHACGRTADGKSPAVALGAGAAGGVGFALLHLGARREPGLDGVLSAIGFDAAVASHDLVVTGEGRFDWQSLRGKVISGVCTAAMAHGRPVLVLAGQLDVGRREWLGVGVSGAYGIIDADRPDAWPADRVDEAMARGPELLADLAERASRTWSR